MAADESTTDFCNGRTVLEVGPHQYFDRTMHAVVFDASRFSNPQLLIAGQKLDRTFKSIRILARQRILGMQLAQVGRLVVGIGDPLQQMHVPQPAQRPFHIRFQLLDGGPVLAALFFPRRDAVLEERVPPPHHCPAIEPTSQQLDEFGFSPQSAGMNQRRCQVRVADPLFNGVFHRVDALAQLDPRIPVFWHESFDQAAKQLGDGSLHDKQQVDIRER